MNRLTLQKNTNNYVYVNLLLARYEINGGTESTELGWSATLSRLEGLPTRYGRDVDKVHVDVEHQTDRRMHFKVRILHGIRTHNKRIFST